MPSSTSPSTDAITKGGPVTQVGEGQEADEITPPVTTFGAPAAGEVLAERYELAEHINDDSAGRQVWRGVDVVLRRPVAVVLRYPGGDSATEMLQAAVTASRVVHPNLVGVYDAIDEGERAYVVREWVDGHSLRELVAEDVLDPARATAIAHSVAGAVAAVHATGMVHGNVHPGTVMVGGDGRVVLADARADGSRTPETDLRAVGAVLYYSLTGHWPHAEADLTNGTEGRRRSELPDAVRDSSGALAAPRKVRAGVPTYLDDLTMDLLDPKIEPPSSDVLAAELGRLDAAAEEQYLDNAGPLRFVTGGDSGPVDSSPLGRRKILLGVVALLTVAVVGLVFGVNALRGDGGGGDTPAQVPTQAGVGDPVQESAKPAAKPKKIAISGDRVRVVDPDGKRDGELDGAAAVVDGDFDKGWSTDSYERFSNFGNLKRGMGILVDLGEPRTLTDVQVLLSATGATAELRAGATAPETGSKAGDNQILATFTRIGEAFENYNATKMTFSGFQPDAKYRYLLFWITDLPQTNDGRYKIGVEEITVQGL